MDNYADFLQAVYSNAVIPIDHKGGPTPFHEYLKLLVVEKERVNREDVNVITKATLCGEVDEIMSGRETIDVEDVFKQGHDRRAVKFVLVEGVPGIGKSTFAWEFCQRWQKCAVLRAFSAIIFLRLYESSIQEASSLTELLYHDNPDIEKAIATEITASGGENILFILDSFDEVPVHIQQTFFLGKIIRGELLPKASILVTCRSSARANLLSLRRPNKTVEVLGFAPSEVDKMARGVFRSKLQIYTDYCTYITCHPVIRSLLYSPLNAAIVVEIYFEFKLEDKPFPQTLTQLYSELTLVFMWRYFKNGRGGRAVESLPDTIGDLRRKQPEIHTELLGLAKLAYDGTLEQKRVFEQLPDGSPDLGLMTVSQHFHVNGQVLTKYSFAHFTLQQFLAAVHLAYIPASEQQRAFKEYNSFPGMDLVWMFVAGLTGFVDLGWKLVRLSQAEEDGCVTPFVLRCLYEAQEKVTIESVWEDSKVLCSCPETLFDCFAIGYCMAKAKGAWEIDLSAGKLGEEALQMLVYGLRSLKHVVPNWWFLRKPEKPPDEAVQGSIVHLDLSFTGIAQNGLAHLRKIPYNLPWQLTHLELAHCQLDGKALDDLASMIHSMFNLTLLDIGGNPVAENEMVRLIHSLEDLGRLQTLSMHHIPLGYDEIVSLSRLIVARRGGGLKRLSIGDSGMQREYVELLLRALFQPTSLEHLTLWELELTPDCFAPMEHNQNLTTLKLLRCKLSSDDLPFLAAVLRSNTTLESLYIGDGHLCVPVFIQSEIEDGLSALAHALQLNRSLKLLSVHLSDSALEREGVQALVGALQYNQTLESLVLPQHYLEGFSHSELRAMDGRMGMLRCQGTDGNRPYHLCPLNM